MKLSDLPDTVPTSKAENYTLRDVTEAIRKDGFPQIQETFMDWGQDGTITGACALGQAAINLGLIERNGFNVLWHTGSKAMWNRVFQMNDSKRYSLEQIANTLEHDYSHLLDTKLGDIEL